MRHFRPLLRGLWLLLFIAGTVILIVATEVVVSALTR